MKAVFIAGRGDLGGGILYLSIFWKYYYFMASEEKSSSINPICGAKPCSKSLCSSVPVTRIKGAYCNQAVSYRLDSIAIA